MTIADDPMHPLYDHCGAWPRAALHCALAAGDVLIERSTP